MNALNIGSMAVPVLTPGIKLESVASLHGEYQYLRLLRECLEEGVYREGRNGGTYGVFGRQIRFNLQDGFPLLTTKKMFFKGIVVELLWFLRGDTNIKYLHDHGVRIWDEWADENGDLGPVYGKQWRSWPTGNNSAHDIPIDQIANVIDGLKKDPYGRRHIVTAWNPAEVDDMALPPCHCLFQFNVANGRLNCQLYQRSADIFLGVPFNIASYALLTHIIAHEVGLQPGEFVHTFGDLHLYANHVEQAKVQLEREPWPFPLLTLEGFEPDFPPLEDLLRNNGTGVLLLSEAAMTGYRSHDAIKAEVSK